MRDLATLLNDGYINAGLTTLKLNCPLTCFPQEILLLGNTLTHLDLSHTGLSSLPPSLGTSLPNLKIAFFSHCRFLAFPQSLASCRRLEMVAFRSNGMTEVPDNALPQSLRWLILTDNRISRLPASIGRCARLEKCMLAGNKLADLPAEMANCTKLALLRLSANRFTSLPSWLFTLPELAFLSYAGNPCSSSSSTTATQAGSLAEIPWADLEIGPTLGSGASGIISKAVWRQSPDFGEDVAVKLFRGALTSDGMPADEMRACLAAGAHEGLISVLGRVCGHPDQDQTQDQADGKNAFRGGIVMQLVPPEYTILGSPPSLESCTRDCFDEVSMWKGMRADDVVKLLRGVAGAAAHLHARGIAHGDIYAHNILVNCDEDADLHALLGDFGAATVYRGMGEGKKHEKVEVLALAHLLEDVLGLVVVAREGEKGEKVCGKLRDLHTRCSVREVDRRPLFEEVEEQLRDIVGWRGMMRFPGC